MSVLPTIGSLVLGTELGGQKISNRRKEKGRERKREGRREDKRKLREAEPSNFSTLNKTGVREPTNCFKQP